MPSLWQTQPLGDTSERPGRPGAGPPLAGAPPRGLGAHPVYVSAWDTGIAPYSDNHLGLPDARAWVDTVYEHIAGKPQQATP